MSSDFLVTLSSIPNERGFKMAFLNVVSLLKKIDEINFSMTNKFIDLEPVVSKAFSLNGG